MITHESQRLSDGIRSGAIKCPDHGFCNPYLGAHMADCQWSRAVDRIYEIYREKK